MIVFQDYTSLLADTVSVHSFFPVGGKNHRKNVMKKKKVLDRRKNTLADRAILREKAEKYPSVLDGKNSEKYPSVLDRFLPPSQ